MLSMLTHDNFNGDLRWISDPLNLNLEDVLMQIEGLFCTSGYFLYKWQNNRFKML